MCVLISSAPHENKLIILGYNLFVDSDSLNSNILFQQNKLNLPIKSGCFKGAFFDSSIIFLWHQCTIKKLNSKILAYFNIA